MLEKKRLQSGFTLIEVMVVISITALLMVLSVPNFHTYERNARVRDSAKVLRSFFWEAQGLAMAPKTADITKYSISLIKGQDSNTKFMIKDSNGTVVSEVALKKDVVIDNVLLDGSSQSSAFLINFKTGNRDGGKMEFSTSGKELVVRLSSSLSTLKYDIVLNTTTSSINLKKV